MSSVINVQINFSVLHLGKKQSTYPHNICNIISLEYSCSFMFSGELCFDIQSAFHCSFVKVMGDIIAQTQKHINVNTTQNTL